MGALSRFSGYPGAPTNMGSMIGSGASHPPNPPQDNQFPPQQSTIAAAAFAAAAATATATATASVVALQERQQQEVSMNTQFGQVRIVIASSNCRN